MGGGGVLTSKFLRRDVSGSSTCKNCSQAVFATCSKVRSQGLKHLLFSIFVVVIIYKESIVCANSFWVGSR